MSSSDPPDSAGRRALLKATSLASVLFFALHQLYLRLGDWMHGYTPPTDPARVNAWLRHWVGEHDGIETGVMMIAVTGCLLAGYLVVRWLPHVPWFPWWPVQLACLVPAATVLLRIETSNFTPLDTPGGKLRTAAIGLALAALGALACRLTTPRPWLGRSLLALSLVALGAFVMLSGNQPASFDYGFFIAPAHKLAQGEPLGSFYIQYNLIGTYLFRLMMAFDLRLHQMQAVLSVICVLWVGLYFLLARRLIESRFIVFLFVVALLLVRVVAIEGGPTFYPQVTTLRMDLWVVLALVLERYGFTSRVTSAAFALVYVADNVFGLVFFAFYAAVLGATLVAEGRAGRRPTLATLAGLGVPLALALGFQLWTFGGLTNPAGKLYQDVHLGFLPISLQSMFWGVAWVLLAAIGPLARDPDQKRRGASLFLLAFAAGQLLYFYGRSHDHNLLNLSGIWLLILFVALDRLRHCGLPRAVGPIAATLVVCLACVGTARMATQKLDRARERLARGVLIEPTELDRAIDAGPDPLAEFRAEPKVFLFGKDEAYLNYRYGLRQVGFFAPFYASVFTEPTAEFVRGLLLEGYKVVLPRGETYELLTLNDTQAMRSSGQQFSLVRRGAVLEAVLVGR